MVNGGDDLSCFEDVPLLGFDGILVCLFVVDFMDGFPLDVILGIILFDDGGGNGDGLVGIRLNCVDDEVFLGCPLLDACALLLVVAGGCFLILDKAGIIVT